MTAHLLVLVFGGAAAGPFCEQSGALRMTTSGVTVVASREGFRTVPESAAHTEPEEEAAGEDGIAMGEGYRLTVGPTWRLRVGANETELDVPGLLRTAEHIHVLGAAAGRVWVGGSNVLGVIELDSGRVRAARLARRRSVPLAVSVGESARLMVGSDVIACKDPNSCSREARLPGPVTGKVDGPSGMILAIAGSEAGLYRAPPGRPADAVLLVSGSVSLLCDEGNGDAWSLLRRGPEVRLVAATTVTPAVRVLTPDEVLALALIEEEAPDAQATERVLELAAAEGWRRLERLGTALLRDRRPSVRGAVARALGSLATARATAALWLLGHDPDVDVRLAALQASIRRCESDRTLTCTQILGSFLADADTDVDWTARDVILDHDPKVALGDASVAYKLDAIASLVMRLQRDGAESAHAALKLLAADRDPKVRNAASMALVGNLP